MATYGRISGHWDPPYALDLLTVGLVNDMYIESDNDSESYAQVATQAQMDAF